MKQVKCGIHRKASERNLYMKKIRAIPLIITILIMALIFFFSSQTSSESSEVSRGLTRKAVHLFLQLFHLNGAGEAAAVSVLHHYIRKLAHFLLYALLGILSAVTMRITFKRTVSVSVICAAVICVLYSISDEIHQLFISGRSGQISDVFLDSAGAWTGIAVLLIFLKIKKGDRISDD